MDPIARQGSIGPAVAGTWYPAEAVELGRQVDGFLGAAQPAPGAPAQGRVVALVAPHAGYAYSGAVAGRGFVAVRGARVARVLLVGPSHYAAFAGGALPRAAAYRTPLGSVGIDHEVIERMAGAGGAVSIDDAPFGSEHSLEAELPFLQRTLVPGWRLVPLLIGAESTCTELTAVAKLLEPWLGPDTLVVVSSDFTHFGPRFRYVPFDREVPERIEQLDMGAVHSILARDVAAFEAYVERTGTTICGRDAIGVLLRLLPDGLSGALAGYDLSGRITGNWDHSVSYASLIFREPWSS